RPPASGPAVALVACAPSDRGSGGGRMSPARFLLAGFCAAVAVAPLVLSPYLVTLLNYIGLYSIVALGLVLLTGMAGLTSFGQAAFVGVGAYATAVLSTRLGLSPWLGLPVGLGLTAAVAWVLGHLTLRLSRHYLVLGTIAWGSSLSFVFCNVGWLGGFNGISDIPALPVPGGEIASARDFAYLIWAIVLLASVSIVSLLDSRPGRAIRALPNGVLAESLG